ncbi:hypothetical protein EDD85DRAFT_915269 [Armillaria nabsnona]|nr:hypothetical protein EDD85DRAFT_915269 [Armillaria nabsnona]
MPTRFLSTSRTQFPSAFYPRIKIIRRRAIFDDLAIASCFQSGVTDRIKDTLPIEKVCLLDPKAEKDLSPEDGDGRFEWFLFGGTILHETGLRALTRRLGPAQTTTDTALGVTKLVVEDKIPIDKIPYVDYRTITFNPKESVEMPSNTSPKAQNRGMRQLLHENLNKSFDF